MAKRTVSIRLAVENQETVMKALRQLGEEGQAALRQIERGTAPASKGLLALNAAGKDVKGTLGGWASRLGPLGAGMEALGPAGLAAAAGIAGVIATGAGLVALTNRITKVGDELDEMSAATGVSVEHLSTLGYAADISGSSLEGLGKGLKALSANALSAYEGLKKGSGVLEGDAKVWQELGIQVTGADGKIRPMYDLLLSSADALRAVTNDTERAALAQKLFGRAGMEMLPVLSEGSEGIRRMEERARALGGEFSTQGAKDAARYQDAIQGLSVAMGGLGRDVAMSVVPALTETAELLSEIIALRHRLPTPTATDSEMRSSRLAALLGDWQEPESPLPNPLFDRGQRLQITSSDIEALTSQRQRLTEAGLTAEMEALRAAGERRQALEKEIDLGVLSLRQKHQADLKALEKTFAEQPSASDQQSREELRRLQTREIATYTAGKRREFDVQETARLTEQRKKDADERLQFDQQLVARRQEVFSQGLRQEAEEAASHGKALATFEYRQQAEITDLLVQQRTERQRLAEKADQGQLEQLQRTQAQELAVALHGSYASAGVQLDAGRQAVIDRYAALLSGMTSTSDEAGRQSARQLLQALRRELQVNEDSDVKLVLSRVGTTSAESFGAGFETSLSGAFLTILEGGSVADALAVLGQGTVDTLFRVTADGLSSATTELGKEYGKAGLDAAGSFTLKLGGGIADYFRKPANSGLASQFTSGIKNTISGQELSDLGDSMGNRVSGGLTGRLLGDLTSFFRQELPANGPPIASMFSRLLNVGPAGSEIGTNLGIGITTALTTALTGKTLQSFGLNFPDRIILTVALADGLAAKLKADADPLGQRVGEGIQSGLTTFMMGQTLNSLTGNRIPTNLVLGVSLSSGFLSEFAPQSETISKITEGVSGAFKGAVLGAGIGTLFGDQITAQQAAISAALGNIVGQAIGGATGGLVGSGIGALVASVYDMIKGDSAKREQEQQAIKEVSTDISAFGGVGGFWEKIGGIAGITGERAQQFSYTGVTDLFETMLRTQKGLTREEAEQMIAAIQYKAEPNIFGSLSSERITELSSTLPALFAKAGMSYDLSQSGLDYMRDTTFTGWRDGLYYENGTLFTGSKHGVNYYHGRPDVDPGSGQRVDNGDPAGKVVVSAEPPPAGTTTTAPPTTTTPPPVSSGTSIAEAQTSARATSLAGQLAEQLASARVSKSFLRGIGPDIDAVLNYLSAHGIPNTTGTLAWYWKDYAAGKDDPGVAYGIKQMYGIDVVAARGFAGTVNRPTTFLAGEAGPEDVAIIPQSLRRGITGGGIAGREVHLFLTFNVYTPSVQSMASWARTDFYPTMRQLMMEDSRAGRPVIHEKGIVGR